MNRLLAYLRDFKILQTLYNIYHLDQLQHNKSAYKKYNIQKFLFSSVSTDDFAYLPQIFPWLDDPNESVILKKISSLDNISNEKKGLLNQWYQKGYIIIPNFFSTEQIASIDQEIIELLNTNKVRFNAKEKIMSVFRQSEKVRSLISDKRLTGILSLILGKNVFPFQTINFLRGSGQRPHSDSMHMSTYPPGNLIAAWIALEDVDGENGPLSYYPGSHKLPYIMNKDFVHGGNKFRIGRFVNARYEDHIAKQIKQHHLQKEYFLAKKGDLFIWHANLLHGGEPILKKERTRKSMVVHYFAEDVIKYHELTQRPALIYL